LIISAEKSDIWLASPKELMRQESVEEGWIFL
jgi:hypothetical protein